MEKDTLVSQAVEMRDPYKVKPEDFKAPDKAAADGQSGLAHGTAVGMNELAMQSENQVGPRHAEDPGDNMPSDWQSGGRSAIVARNFPVRTNTGEGDEAPSKIACAVSIDCETGMIVGPNVVEKVKTVADPNAHVPSR